MKFKGILFDLDGTLIDSMNDNYIAWKYALNSENISITKEEYYPLEGMPVREIAKFFLEKKNYSLEKIQKIIEIKHKFYKENCKIRFYKGVKKFIDYIKSRNVLIAIVSASSYEKLNNTIPRDFLDKFDCLISGDCTKRGKPYPDPYITAAEKLGLKVQDCVVIENAPIGIESAKNAKMFCIAIGSTLPKKKLDKADIFINKFEDLNDLEQFK
jgi:beta-phosphoglucomutase